MTESETSLEFQDNMNETLNTFEKQAFDLIVENEVLIARLNKAESRVTELEVFADKVVNWNEQFSIKTRCDIGSLGQQQHFQQLAAKVLRGNNN